MTDTASIFSTTETLVDWRDAHALLARDPSDEGSSRLLSVPELYATILVSFHLYKPDVDQLTAAGFPTVIARGSKPVQSSSGSTSNGGFLPLGRKRYQVQIPLLALDDRQTKHLANPTSWQEARQRAADAGLRRGLGSTYTLLESMLAELVNYRERPMLHQVLRLLFYGSDVRSPALFYPAHLVRRVPKWATCSSDAARREVAAASAGVRWATLLILTAPLDGSRSNVVSKEREKEYFEDMKNNQSHKFSPDTDEAAQRRFEGTFTPTAAAEEKLQRILDTLQSRGALWTAAGHDTNKTMRNEDPSKRPAFLVQGLFPEAMLDRFKDYHRSSMTPMSSDLSEEAKSKRAPLLLDPVSSAASTSTADKEDRAPDSAHIEDGLEGCAVRVVPEPFKTGSPWEAGGSAAVFMGAGAGAAGGGF
ncbi:hypothetical protein FA10DRAFT_277351 [Acaromyces ingoldii]|uniref:Uncharacterized protein n=1 Tax=Acaromyces ingoldii TaxID=215250 RepID=A0A316Z0E3_9BASI|nr:hypothetical protein FA10DRAFT_277351 [Acaromyces ingoldii]PWN93565.1 hypothetical protein FA10DRAFT_277351 [Acaromyces ingoldii]